MSEQAQTPVHVQAQPDGKAHITARDCVCATCWGHLLLFPAPGRKWFVLCARCGTETRGYVTKAGVERRRQQDIGDYLDVRENYRELLPARPKVDEETRRKELGLGG